MGYDQQKFVSVPLQQVVMKRSKKKKQDNHHVPITVKIMKSPSPSPTLSVIKQSHTAINSPTQRSIGNGISMVTYNDMPGVSSIALANDHDLK